VPEDFELPEVMTENITEAGQAGVDPLYERQASLGLAKPSVILVGAGGVGCWVGLALVLGGVDNLTIYDGDVISIHNLNRFPLPETMVGEPKSVSLAKWLRSLRPKAQDINARGMFDPAIDETAANMGYNWLVCCTDSLKSRKMCYRFAQEYGMKYLEVGADGERWTLSPAPPEFSTELEDNPGYQTVPVHVGPCMMAGAVASYYILHNTIPTVSHLIDWDKGPVYNNRVEIYGSLKIASMDEGNLPDPRYPMIDCPKCHRLVEGNLINLIRHIRQCYPNLGLVEAKPIAESLIAKATPLPLNQAEEKVLEEHMAHLSDPEFDRELNLPENDIEEVEDNEQV
jgi:hypothetical protein